MLDTHNTEVLQLEPMQLVLSILRRENGFFEEVWELVNAEMKQAMAILGTELGLGFVKRKFMRFYWWYVARKMLDAADQGRSMDEIETMVASITAKVSNDAIKLPYLRNRAQRAYNTISDLIRGDTICDLGCGDGMLAQLLAEDYQVITADVVDYRAAENSHLEFVPMEQDQPINLGTDTVDTTVLWTVLHHSDDPAFLLDEATRISSSRIIIVEGYVDDIMTRAVNCFYDWYMNRPGKGEDINVPFNYRTTSQWHQLVDNLGWTIVQQQYLGIDEPVAPERHVLYVMEPKS